MTAPDFTVLALLYNVIVGIVMMVLLTLLWCQQRTMEKLRAAMTELQAIKARSMAELQSIKERLEALEENGSAPPAAQEVEL